jgi:hypothetical protein
MGPVTQLLRPWVPQKLGHPNFDKKYIEIGAHSKKYSAKKLHIGMCLVATMPKLN